VDRLFAHAAAGPPWVSEFMRTKKIEPFLFLAPALVVLLLVFGYPIYRMAVMSLQRTSGGNVFFSGLNNFQIVFKDGDFIQAVQHNLILLICVPIMVFAALFLAILLFERIRGWQFYRTTLFLPYLLPITVVGLVFSYIFQLSGVLNDILNALGLQFLALDWLGSTKLALPTLMFVIVWKEMGFGVILFLARLMSVEEELFDAAKIDGANWWQLQLNITIPQLSTVIEFFTVISVVTMLSWVFNYVYVMTGGGPGHATTVTELYIYLMAFQYSRLNLAAAVSVLMLLVVGVFIFLELYLRDRSSAVEALG
jgi:ABC-type sugar transport system permease subunit